MYTFANVMSLLSHSAVTYVDSAAIPQHILTQLEAGPFVVDVFDATARIIVLSRDDAPFAKVKVDSWTVNNGVVKFTTPTGKWISLASMALASPFRFTKVVYRYTEIWDEVPDWYRGTAEPTLDGYELQLVESLFIPDGQWGEEESQWVASLRDEGCLIYKGDYVVRESLLDDLKPLRERYNSYGAFGFASRRQTKKEALGLAYDKWEKDFIRWYITQ